MASDEAQALSAALQRAEAAEHQICEYKARFTDKYGVSQLELLRELNELKASLVEDEKCLKAKAEQIHLYNEVIKQSFHQLRAVKAQLILERNRCIAMASDTDSDDYSDDDVDDDDDAKHREKEDGTLDAEDFRLMMKQYFSEIKTSCLSAKGLLNTEQLWDKVIAPNYKLSTEQLRSIRNLFVKDMRFGLSKNENKRQRSSLRMLPSKIRTLPGGHEQGVVFALDWIGDTFRILRCCYF